MMRAKLKQLLLGDSNGKQDVFAFVDSALQSGVAERKAVLEVSCACVVCAVFTRLRSRVQR